MFIRTIFPDLFLTSMLPAIDEVVMGRYAQFPDQYSQVFRMETSDRWGEQTTEITGFGQMAVVPEAKQTIYDEALPGFNQTYTHTQYSLGFKVSKIAIDDDRFGVVKKLASELGKSAHETKEVVCANVFNTGFNDTFAPSTVVGPDGVTLFSTAHPLIGGGTQTNRLSYATDPDVTSIRLALTDMRTTVDHRGKKVRIPAKKLICPPALGFVGSELLGGTDRSDTANRAINSFRKIPGMPNFSEVMVWEYLTDPNAWFIAGDAQESELRHYDREKFNTVHDIEFDSRSVKTAGWMRFSVGYNGFYAVYGVPSS